MHVLSASLAFAAAAATLLPRTNASPLDAEARADAKACRKTKVAVL